MTQPGGYCAFHYITPTLALSSRIGKIGEELNDFSGYESQERYNGITVIWGKRTPLCDLLLALLVDCFDEALHVFELLLR